MSSADPSVPASAPMVPIFAALGDATRLDLVTRLSDGQPHPIRQLSEGLDLSRQGVTKHLRVLEEAGLVTSRRVGRETRFSLVPQPIEEARSYLDGVSRQWDAALDRLRAFLDEP